MGNQPLELQVGHLLSCAPRVSCWVTFSGSDVGGRWLRAVEPIGGSTQQTVKRHLLAGGVQHQDRLAVMDLGSIVQAHAVAQQVQQLERRLDIRLRQ